MADIDRALGRGAEGVSYRSPAKRRPTLLWRVKTFCWYRFGWGRRPTRPE